MRYSFKFIHWPMRCLLAIVVGVVGCMAVSCSDEPDEPTYNWSNHLNIRLFSKEGQNLLTVDPELNSLINEEFVVKIEADPHKEQKYEVLRALVHPWEDSTYFYEWFLPDAVIPKCYILWKVNEEGEMELNGNYPLDNYSQLTPIYGFSSHDKLYRDYNAYCMTSSFFCLNIGYREWEYKKADRTFHVTLEWPRGGMVWNFEHFVPAGHKGDRLYLNGKELDKATDIHDRYFLDLTIEDESLYKGCRYKAD